jgi:hypothetical protein
MSKTILLAIALFAVVFVAPARAQEEVGAVAAVQGTAEALHPGTSAWAALTAGAPILLGDQLRTGAASKLKVLFRDDSVMTLAPNSQLTVNEQVVPTAGGASRFTLTVGTVRAVVTEQYGKAGARFEVETPTAVAGVRGTSFIAQYDISAEETTVVGLEDVTNVRSKLDGTGGRAVDLKPGEVTRVKRGAYPLRPQLMPEDQLRGLTSATEVKGTAAPAGPAPGPGARGGGRSSGATPGGPGGLTPEGRAIDQPIETLRNLETESPRPPPPPPPPPPRR